MDNSFDSLLNASAVPQDEKVQAFIAESRNNRNRCYELSEQVTAQVATDGKMLQKYLDVQSTFDRYTTNNALLILAQRPDAQKLGDYGYWRDHGFYLKRMERQNPVLILEPGKTYKRVDFKERLIKPEALHEGWQTGGSARLTRLAFNLWNGYVEKVEESLSTPYEMFDCGYAPYFYEAIRMKYPEYCRELPQVSKKETNHER